MSPLFSVLVIEKASRSSSTIVKRLVPWSLTRFHSTCKEPRTQVKMIGGRNGDCAANSNRLPGTIMTRIKGLVVIYSFLQLLGKAWRKHDHIGWDFSNVKIRITHRFSSLQMLRFDDGSQWGRKSLLTLYSARMFKIYGSRNLTWYFRLLSLCHSWRVTCYELANFPSSAVIY